jgi:hypothetical protein
MARRTAIAEKITGIARTTAAAEIGGCQKTPRPTEIRADSQARGGLAGQPIAFFVAVRVRQHASMFPPATGNRQ